MSFGDPTNHPPRPSGQAARVFKTGASRNSDAGKPDYEGYLSPLAIEAFGRYMTKHRVMEDGSLRDSDNWQQGIPQDQLMKSLLRHVFDLWAGHRGHGDQAYERFFEALNGIIFNVQAYSHEVEKRRLARERVEDHQGERPTPTPPLPQSAAEVACFIDRDRLVPRRDGWRPPRDARDLDP